VTPRESRLFAVFGFATTHDALAAEAALKAAGVTVTPIPAPHGLGSLCGIALRLELSDADVAVEVFAGASIAPTVRAEIADV
jgi:diphthamide biosynthesis methyltransferase